MKILLCGDSYATDFKQPESWVSEIQKIHTVTNLALAGISEYKILKQIESRCHIIDQYQLVIVCHTSPNRVHIPKHPVHKSSATHQSSDLLFSDVEYHLTQHSTDPALLAAYGYFLHIFDHEYYLDLYCMMQREIKDRLQGVNSLHLTNFEIPNYVGYEDYVDLKKELLLESGSINHYNINSNRIISKFLKTKIEKINEQK